MSSIATFLTNWSASIPVISDTIKLPVEPAPTEKLSIVELLGVL